MLRLFKLKTILIGLFVFMTLISGNLYSQGVTSVDYQAKYNDVDCLWDFYIIIQEGTATTIPERAQFNSQYSIVVPTGTVISGAPINYMPLQNNQSYTGTVPLKWTLGTPVINPAASPGNDFYGVTPTLSPASFYNNLAPGDTIRIFSLDISPITECGEGIRLFDNDTDPGSNEPGMGGGDFSNGFTIGGSTQDYNTNAPKVDPSPPVLSATNECTDDLLITLEALTSSCQEPLTYSWTGPDGFTSDSSAVAINGATEINNGTYFVTVTDAFGCFSELQVEGEVKPNAGDNVEGCPDGSVNLQGNNPATGTWTADGTNPSGATLVPGAAGAATVNFDGTAAGVYNFIYTNVVCSDTVAINIIIPDAGPDPSTVSCFSAGTASINADGTQNGVWSVDPSSAGTAVIGDASSASTIVNGFSAPGDYILVWTVGACSDFVTISTEDMCGCAISSNTLNPINPNVYCGTSGNVTVDGETATPSGTYLWEYSFDGGSFATAPGTSTNEDYITEDLGLGNHTFRRIYTTDSGVICSDTSNTVAFNVFEVPPVPSNLVASPSTVCVLETTNLSVTDNPGATYTWSANSPDAGLGTSTTNTNTMSPTVAGVYTISVTQTVDGCESPPATIDVTVVDLPPTPDAGTTSFTDPTSCGADDGTISLSGYTPSETYTVLYSYNGIPNSIGLTANGSGVLTFVDLPPGTYTNIQIISSIGCASGVYSGPVTLSDPSAPPPPDGIMASPNPECLGSPITISVTNNPGATYTWSASSPNAGLGSSTTNTVTMNALVAGFYIITVNQTVAGCTSPDTTISVAVNDSPPTPTGATVAGTNPSVCGGMDGFISLNGYSASTSYDITYAKNGVDTTYSISSNGSGVIIIPNLSEGTYSNFTVTNVTGCDSGEFPGPVNLSDPGSPPAPTGLSANPNPVCLGNTVTLSVDNTPGATFNWSASSPDAGLSAGTGNIVTMDAVTEGTYTISVSVTVAGCTSPASNIDVVVSDTAPTPSSLTPSDPTSCGGADGSISISGYTPSADYDVDYEFNGSPQSVSVTADGSGNLLITGLSAGTYTNFQVTNTANCPSDVFAGPVDLTDPNPPPAPTGITADPNPICQGESMTISVDNVPGAVYTWDITPADAGFGSSTSNSITFTPVGSGVFDVSVFLTLNNCVSGTSNINAIVEPSPDTPIAADISSTDPTFCTGMDGTISIANLDPSVTYGVQYDSASITINKVIAADVSGVITITGLSAGSYSNIILTNSSGCASGAFIGPVILVDPGAPGAPTNLTGVPNPSCLGTTVNLSVTNDPSATYTWTTPSGDAGLVASTTNATTMTATVAGIYTVFVTQTIAGCTSPPAQIDITVSDVPPTPDGNSVVGVDPSSCGVTDGTITISGLIPSTTYTLTYSTNGTPATGPFTTNGSGEIVLTGLSAGDYTNFSLVNAALCSSGIYSGPVTLTEPAAPGAPTAVGTDPSACGVDNGSILVSGMTPSSSITLMYTYNGSPVSGTFMTNASGEVDLTDLAAGSYANFSYTNATGCTSGVFAGPVVLSEPNAPPAPTGIFASPNPICLGETVALGVDPVSGATFTWSASSPNAGLVSSTAENTTMTPTAAGTYTISVFYTLAGCDSPPITIDVTANPLPPTPSAGNVSSTDPTACAADDGTITIGGYNPGDMYTLNYTFNGSPQVADLTATGSGDLELLFLVAGTYGEFSVVNVAGCSSGIYAGPVVLIDPNSPPPPTNLVANPNPICLGGTVQLSVDFTAGATYTWSISPGGIVLNTNGNNTNSFVATTSGVYTISVFQEISGCTSPPTSIDVLVIEDCVNPDFGVTYNDIQLTGDLSTNDSNIGASTYTNVVASGGNPAACMPVVASNGTYTFDCSTPGEYEYLVDVCKVGQSAGCVSVPLVITVLDIAITENPPIANHDYIATTTNNDVEIDILANDKCQSIPGCVLTNLSVVISPVFGSYNTNTGIYTPNNGFVGRDSFRYEVCQDPTTPQSCDQEWVYIDVYPFFSVDFTNAMDDYNQTALNSTLDVDAANGVLSNDTDPQDNLQGVVSFPITSVPGKGSISYNSDGSYSFVPETGFVGPVDFEYRVCRQNNGSICASATLHILVEPQAAAGSIGSCVWEDLDADGIMDSNEPPIFGVEVNLYTDLGELYATDYTDNAGFYQFDDLPVGSYFLEFIKPDDMEFTFPNVGDDNFDSDVDDSNGPGTTAIYSIAAGQFVDNVKAGLYRCNLIGENVWYDVNENDVFDDFENGINGLKVYLWRLNFGVWEVWDYTTTGQKPNSPSDDGWYQFCAPPGTYYIEIPLPPSGLVQVIPFVGSNKFKDSDINNGNGPGTTNSFTINNGQDKLDIGAGYYPMAEAGNLVWHDENFDGIQNQEEGRIANVLVEVFDANTNNLLGQDVTNEEGIYHIEDLEKVDVYFKFTPPPTMVATIADSGNDEIDSDVDHTYGINTTRKVSMQPGDFNEHIDFGVAFGSLPVNWLDVSVRNVKEGHRIDWDVEQEVNLESYEVQRSLNSISDFVTVSNSRIVANNVLSKSSYSFVDEEELVGGTYYYRIKQYDFDGKSNYSPRVSIRKESTLETKMYPNPTLAITNIAYKAESDGALNIKVIDVTGKVVKVITNEVEEGSGVIELDITDLPEGVYNVAIELNNSVNYKKLIKVK